MRFLFAASWGIAVLIGLIGWGTLLGTQFRPGRKLPWGLCAAIGFSFSVVIGGLLGLFNLILPAVVIGFVGMGLPLLLLRSWNQSAKPLSPVQITLTIKMPTYVFALLTAALILLAGCRYLSSVHETQFQPLDDIPAYLVFPLKMLQTGHFAPDPYSDRRMNGLGGQEWSQAMVIAPFDVSTIDLFDHGIAFVVLLILCRDWVVSIGGGRSFVVLLLLTITLIYPNYVNTSSFVMISALLMAIFVLLLDRVETTREAIVLALLVSAICSLKNTVIPFVGTILAVYFLVRTIQSKTMFPLLYAAGVAALAFIFLLPWMQSMHQSSTTFLAPLLGHGNSTLGTLSGQMPNKTAILLLGLSLACAVGALIIIGCLWRDPNHRRWAWTAFAFLLGTAPIVYLVATATGGLGWMRYAQPFIYGWISFPIPALWIWSNSGGLAKMWLGRSGTAALAAIAVLSSIGWARPYGPIQVIARECSTIADGLRWRPAFGEADHQQALALQQSVPAGAAILARVNLPYLFNFARNPVYICDHPGLAYPPPGLPEGAGPLALRDFLLRQGVRYVAYSYGDEANFRRTNEALDGTEYAWNRIVTRRALDFQNSLQELEKSQHVLYDDKMNFMVDLQR